MPRPTTRRLVRAVTLPLWKRDQLEMRAADRLLTVFEPRPKRRRAPSATRAADQQRAMNRREPSGHFRSILCPVDFSEPSRSALRYAVAIALRGRATLRVFYVNNPLLVASAAVALHDRQFVKRSARELDAFIDTTISAKTRARLRVTSRVSIGRAAEEILKEGRRRKSDLIVIGTHGLSGADRLLVGSTTLSVLLRTKVPVLAVPPAPHRRPASRPR